MNREVSAIYNNFIRMILPNYLFFKSRIKLVSFRRFPLLRDNSYMVYLYCQNVTFSLELVAII